MAQAATPAPLRSRTNLVCLALLGLMLLVFAYQGLIDDESGGLREIQDYVITWSLSQRVVDDGAYFRDFTYALPAVVFKLVFAAPGLPASSVVWMALLIAAAFAVARALVVLLGRERSEQAYLAPLLAFLAVVYSVQWDYRAVNTNMIFLALVLWSLVWTRRGRPGLGGFLLATSISLKLYSVVLLPYWLLQRRWDVLAWTSGWLVFWFAAIPAAWFGPEKALELTWAWAATILGTSDRTFVLDLIAYKVSLYHVMLAFFHAEGAGAPSEVPRLAQLSLDAVFYLARSIQLVAIALVGGHLIRTRRRPEPMGEDVRLLIDTGLLLQLMLFLSPLLEPHHPVLLLIPAAVLAHIALDSGEQPRWRAAAAMVLALTALLTKLAPSGVYKGLALNVTIVAFAVSVALLRGVVRDPARASAS